MNTAGRKTIIAGKSARLLRPGDQVAVADLQSNPMRSLHGSQRLATVAQILAHQPSARLLDLVITENAVPGSPNQHQPIIRHVQIDASTLLRVHGRADTAARLTHAA